jgi:hypothetical protein
MDYSKSARQEGNTLKRRDSGKAFANTTTSVRYTAFFSHPLVTCRENEKRIHHWELGTFRGACTNEPRYVPAPDGDMFVCLFALAPLVDALL